MADEFERFLESSLAPEERLPDRRFVAAAQARIALEERLERQRRALAASLGTQLIGLASVAAAVSLLTRATPFSDWIGEFPAAALAIMVVGFALFVTLFARLSPEGASPVSNF